MTTTAIAVGRDAVPGCWLLLSVACHLTSQACNGMQLVQVLSQQCSPQRRRRLLVRQLGFRYSAAHFDEFMGHATVNL